MSRASGMPRGDLRFGRTAKRRAGGMPRAALVYAGVHLVGLTRDGMAKELGVNRRSVIDMVNRFKADLEANDVVAHDLLVRIREELALD